MLKYLLIKYTSKASVMILSMVTSITIGQILKIFTDFVPKQIFGITLALWIIALLITLWDSVTGVAAYKKEQKDKQKTSKFESRKGWRAIEKVFGFSVIIGFIYSLEQQMLLYEYPVYMSSSLMIVKIFFFIYGILLELQSVGENKERLSSDKNGNNGTKGKPFKILDLIINFTSQAIVKRIAKTFGLSKEEVDDIKEEIEEEKED